MPALVLATTDDAAAILELQRRAYQAEARLYNDWTIPPLVQDLGSLRAEMGTATVLKAVAADVLVGSVRACVEEQTCRIGRLMVEPAWQGRGIGSALLRAIEAAFPQASRFELFTGSRSADNIRLYRRHGYAITGTRPLSDQVSLVILSKPAPGVASGQVPS